MITATMITQNPAIRAVAAAAITAVTCLLASPHDSAAQGNPSAPAADTLPLYYEYQVEETAKVVSWKTPTYPDSLRARKLEGEVLLQFVVDTTGRMERASLKITRSTHAAFANAVMATLSSARFTPAVRNGRPVRQLMEQPFIFAPKR